jgi:PDZ domain
MRFSILFVSLLSLAGCASNGYRQFYTEVPGATPEKVAARRAAPPPPTPEFVRLAGPFDDNAQRPFLRKGYEIVGYSSFTSGRQPDEDDALDQGKKVGADLVVLLAPHYVGSVTTSIPLTTPTVNTSYTNGTATVYGSGGSAVAYGNATTTTYGTNTTYVPMTVNRNEYTAVYLVKAKHRFGVRMRDLSDAERRELGTNQGLYVTTVIEGTPAFASDILPGDVIMTIEGSRIEGNDSFTALLSARSGQAVAVTLIRQGKTITKTVALGP